MSGFQEKLKEFNEGQQAAILSDENTVVSAGAGAGKTKTLSARFLYLVTEQKLDVNSILCLTFTKKPTTEMYSRIYAELKKNADNSYAKKALENFQSARISTLDSVCNSIARYASRSYSITPDFQIDQKASEQIAEDVAMAFFLKNAHHPAIQKLVMYNSIEGVISKLFVPMLNSHSNITSLVNFDEVLVRQKEIIIAEYAKNVERLRAIVDALVYITENVQDEKIKKLALIKNLKEILETTPFELSQKMPDDIYAFLKSQGDTLKILFMLMEVNLASKSDSEEVKECKEKITELREEFSIFNSLCNYDASFIKEVFSLLTELEAEYIEAKKTQGILNYTDVSNIALDALKNDVSLRNYYKQSIKTIMIDEFQDNNQVQRDILFLLAENMERTEKSVPSPSQLEKGKLFFVGDEKQSIYAFRGADVSVFRRLMTDLNKEIKLDKNYRTEKDLIDIFNTIFPYVFYSNKHRQEDNELPSFEAVFESLQYFQNTQGIDAGLDVICVEKGDDEARTTHLSADETEAHAVANRIKQMYKDGFKVRDGKSGKTRTCKWSDFAILLRSGTKQHNYEKHLKIAGVPYTATNQKWIFSYAPLNDLYAFLRLAIYPQDKKNYAQALKTPFVDLSEKAFLKVMLTCQDVFSDSVDEVLAQDNLQEDLAAFRRGRQMFEEVQEGIKSKTNAEIVQLLWYKWGYRYLLLSDATYHEFLNLYDYLFFMASEADAAHRGMSEFVDDLYNYIHGKAIVEDMDIPTNQKKDAVKIMTVHSSKGLEFPIVIIPDAQNKGKGFQKDEIIFESEIGGLAIHTPDVLAAYMNALAKKSIIKESTAKKSTNKNFFFEGVREEENKKLNAELKRLFYVAMTRAEVKVILSFVFEKNKEATQDESRLYDEESEQETREMSLECFLNQMKCPDYEKANCFFDLFVYSLRLASLAGECERVKMKFYRVPLLERAASKNDIRMRKIDLRECARLVDSVQVKEYGRCESLRLDTAKSGFDGKNESTFLFEPKNEEMFYAIENGEIAHAYLQALVSGDEFDLADFGLTEARAEEIERWVKTFLSSKYGKWALEARVKKTEYGFITKLKDKKEEKLVRGVIDLFFEKEETVYIIDYKTDVRKSHEYDSQLAVYKKAVSDLYKTMSPEKPYKFKAYLFYLRTGEDVEVDV